MDALEELRRRMESFLAADAPREVVEDGELLFADLRRARFRTELTSGKLLLHLWSEERTWVRRVTGIAEEKKDRLALAVHRFGRAKPGRLEIAAPRRARSGERERASARRRYAALLKRLIVREFPGARLEGVSTSADLARSFSGLYTRARLREGAGDWAVLGVNAGEDAAAVDGLLTFALLWLDWNREHSRRAVAGLRLFLPAGRGQVTASRLTGLDSARARIELYEVDEEAGACARRDPRDFGNLQTRLVPARWADEVRAAESSAVERIRALAPGEVEMVVPPGGSELSLRIRGLEFARARGGRVAFGVGGQEQPLTAESWAQLERLVEQIRRERVPGGDARSPLYRLQAERWLESVVLRDAARLEARLDPARLYRQVPALAGGERGLVDLLGATRDGRLVVLELKAASDIQLPLQALDYWLCVRWHQQRRELAAGGYFPGLRLAPEPPELLLVAPALQLHPAVETVVGYLAPEVPITLVGLNEDWRRNLQVVWRRRRLG